MVGGEGACLGDPLLGLWRGVLIGFSVTVSLRSVSVAALWHWSWEIKPQFVSLVQDSFEQL